MGSRSVCLLVCFQFTVLLILLGHSRAALLCNCLSTPQHRQTTIVGALLNHDPRPSLRDHVGDNVRAMRQKAKQQRLQREDRHRDAAHWQGRAVLGTVRILRASNSYSWLKALYNAHLCVCAVCAVWRCVWFVDVCVCSVMAVCLLVCRELVTAPACCWNS
jgi:hypothetical protein